MKLRYTTLAQREIQDILEYLAARSPRAADDFQRQLHRALELACRFPRMGRRTDEPGISMLLLRPFPFLVFYHPSADEIVVHAVRHGARSPRNVVQ